jgi:hypothetical protein
VCVACRCAILLDVVVSSSRAAREKHVCGFENSGVLLGRKIYVKIITASTFLYAKVYQKVLAETTLEKATRTGRRLCVGDDDSSSSSLSSLLTP